MTRERRVLRSADRPACAPGAAVPGEGNAIETSAGAGAEARTTDGIGSVESAFRPVLTLYRRPGCHLCEDLERTLFELVDPAGFVLQRVDVDDDPAARARFDRDVPVLMHGETELCRHFLDLHAVRQALASPDRLQ